MSELKPCPFCGCTAWVHMDPVILSTGVKSGVSPAGWRVECEGDCHAMTCWWHDEEEAIENWNMRHGEPLAVVEGWIDWEDAIDFGQLEDGDCISLWPYKANDGDIPVTVTISKRVEK